MEGVGARGDGMRDIAPRTQEGSDSVENLMNLMCIREELGGAAT